MNIKYRRMFYIIISLMIICILCGIVSEWSEDRKVETVVINEVCSNNFSTAPMSGNEDADWIELFNASKAEINLAGWMISDNEDNLARFVFPDVTIQPGAYLLLAAETQENKNSDRIYLDFRLSEGEKLYLHDAEGKLIDSVLIPATRQNTSYARITDAGLDWVNAIPTPEMTNNDMQLVQKVEIEEPKFSIVSGFYNGVQSLTLSTDDNLSVYYTLDGSEPTQESMMYTEPIIIENRSGEENVLSARSDLSTDFCYRYAPEDLVDKIKVVRAISVDSEGNQSDIVTHSYIVDIHNKECYQDLVTVSLTTEADDFFDYANGLYVAGEDYFIYKDYRDMWEGEPPEPNYKISGIPSERPANIIVFDSEGNVILEQDIGIRIRGNTTRKLSQKSFTLNAREVYGEKVFTADVFGNDLQYDKMLLFSDRDVTKIRHELHKELLQGRDVGLQNFVHCNVFLNGEYWGLYSLAEAYSEEYVENHYGVPRDEVVIEDTVIPKELRDYVKNENNLSEEELYEGLLELIDIDSFIDYYAAMLYIDNWDWVPHNGYCWKSSTISSENPYQDGKWRWMVYDTELSETGYDVNTFEVGNVTTWENDPLVSVLMTSEEFKQKFAATFMNMANTVFEKEHVADTIDIVWGRYSQAVDAQGERWGDDWADEVYNELDNIRTFFDKRYEFIVPYMKEKLGIQEENVETDIEIGTNY